MDVFRAIVLKAVIAGLVAGLLATTARHFTTTAAILRAEAVEGAAITEAPASSSSSNAGHVHPVAASPGHSHGDHDASAAAWQPSDGVERTLYTAAADAVTAIAFALLLAAAMALRGGAITWRSGLAWGAAGCVTFVLAPGIGLPPELPGTVAAPVLARQVWWLATAAATGGALALIFLQRRPALVAAGIVLMVIPHVIGAPQPELHVDTLPHGLAEHFIILATLTNALFWLLLGAVLGLLGGTDDRSRLKAAAPV